MISGHKGLLVFDFTKSIMGETGRNRSTGRDARSEVMIGNAPGGDQKDLQVSTDRMYRAHTVRVQGGMMG